MNDAILEGLRLLRAVFEAQRELDFMTGKTGREADAEWCRRRDALDLAEVRLAEFEHRLATADLARDWKARQVGEDA